MPIGYLWTVAVVSWGVACALTRWPRLGTFAALPALVVSELPFLVGYFLIASTVLALADGDLGSAAGAAAAVVALLALTGLLVIVRRALRAHAALRNTGKPGRPWGRILRAPFFPGRLDVVRVRGLAYGDGPDRTLDVYHRRDRPKPGAPILLHFHGGGLPFRQQGPRSAAPHPAPDQPPKARLCLHERERPAAAARTTLADQGADVRDALAWVRAHAAGFGAEPGTLFLAGSSAGANLAIRAVCDGETRIAGLICRYGYYGDLAPRGGLPPMLIVHGEKDLIPAADVRAFAEARVRAVSGHPVSYAELPGAHHNFDLYESIRAAAVNKAVEQFTSRASAPPNANHRDWRPAQDS